MVRGNDRIWDIGATVLVLLSGVFVLLPIFWVFLTAFKSEIDVYELSVVFRPTLKNFGEIFTNSQFGLGGALVSSLIVSFSTIAIAIPISTMGAYSFVRFRMIGGRAAFFSVLATQFVPAVVIIIPFFLLARDFGMLDRHLTLVVINLAIVTPFAVWMIMGFIEGIPLDTEESAMVDGASRWRVIKDIVIPMAAPGIITAAIFAFILSWNEFLFALMISQQDLRTWPITLALFSDEQGVRWEYLSAAGVIAMAPMFILALLIQKHFVKGMTMGAVR